MTRSVLDTNVLIRAAITPLGAVAPIILRLREGKFTLIYSQAIFDELVEKLELPRIRNKYNLSKASIENFLAVLIAYGERVEPDRKVTVCRDPDDNHIIEVALTGKAEFVVTGDEDLLVLHHYETIRFVTPREFLLELERRSQPDE